METKSTTQTSALIESRNQSLTEMNQSGIKPFGKHLGNDVFAWINPSIADLANTINSFPFPVMWFGNSETIKSLFEADLLKSGKIQTLVSYDNASFYDENKFLDFETNLFGCNDFSMAMQFSSLKTDNQNVLLFTFTGEHANDNYEILKQTFQ